MLGFEPMPEVFISHAEEDSLVAGQLAALLEARGFVTWYYERDVIPGPSYLQQTQQAISQTPAVLLLISSHSLGSREISSELSMAHRYGRCFLPVLVDVPQSELDRRQPEWTAILGLSASVPLNSGNLDSIATRIERGWSLAVFSLHNRLTPPAKTRTWRAKYGKRLPERSGPRTPTKSTFKIWTNWCFATG